MTPKEKALELKEKFDGYICYAEAAVDEILKVASFYNDSQAEVVYFQEVKQELEKL